LEESDRKGETWTADYEQIVANLRNARSELSRFEFSGSRSTGAHPWWRSVEGKEDYAGFELDRVDETFGVPQVVDEALARLEALEDARTAELGDIETQITKLNEQLKATMNLLGGDVGAGAYLSLPIASIAPTLPMVLGVLFAAFLADASEERRRFEEQLNAFARSSADDADFIRAILGERRTTTIPLAGALAGTWIAHAAYEAYRLDPESLTTTGSSVGIGLALLMAAVFLAMSRRVHKSR
jgi:hypothetical protein